jgi:hypothetical protein
MRIAVVIIGLALPLAGCETPADYGSLDLVEVTGKVTLDSQPLEDATVRFEGPPGRFSTGQTDAAGVYRLMYDSAQAGCTPGEKVVRITKLAAAEGGEEEGVIEGADGQVIAAPAVEPIPAEYNAASKLTANVSASNKSFDYDLNSKP